jgi:hypothetical protein
MKTKTVQNYYNLFKILHPLRFDDDRCSWGDEWNRYLSVITDLNIQ